MSLEQKFLGFIDQSHYELGLDTISYFLNALCDCCILRNWEIWIWVLVILLQLYPCIFLSYIHIFLLCMSINISVYEEFAML